MNSTAFLSLKLTDMVFQDADSDKDSDDDSDTDSDDDSDDDSVGLESGEVADTEDDNALSVDDPSEPSGSSCSTTPKRHRV